MPLDTCDQAADLGQILFLTPWGIDAANQNPSRSRTTLSLTLATELWTHVCLAFTLSTLFSTNMIIVIKALHTLAMVKIVWI